MNKQLEYTIDELKIGMRTHGYTITENGNTFSRGGYHSGGTVKEIKEDCVVFDDYREVYSISLVPNMTFSVDAPDEWYAKNYNQEIDMKKVLTTELASYELGEHTMWNGFDMLDAYQMYHDLKEEGFIPVGICYNVPYKDASGYGAGIIFENDETFEKFWVHCNPDWITHMLEKIKEK